MATIRIKVMPNAKRDAFAGWLEAGDAEGGPLLRVRLSAPPVDGKANKALLRFLSRELGVAKSELEIVRGERQRAKTIRLPDAAAAKLRGLRF